MRKIAFFVSLLALWLLLSLGCNKTDQVIVGPVTLNINSAINLTSFEKLSPAAATFEFRCLTDSIYSCANYSVDFTLDTVADTLKLTFTEISRPSVCLPTDGPAFSLISLGDISNGVYQLPITVNGVVATAVLTITDSTFEITGGDSTWTNFPRAILRRIPVNIIWGQVGYSVANAFDSASTFFGALFDIGAAAIVLPIGDYGYLYSDGNGAPDSILELGPSIGTPFRIPFSYSFTGTNATLDSLVAAYRNQGNVVEANIITSQGFEYRTW